MRWMATYLVVAGAACCMAQDAPSTSASQKADSEILPFRFEVGAYGSQVNNGFGTWKGGQAQLWMNRQSARFIPVLFFDSQTRPEGTQQNYGFFSYLNWNKSFYTVQGYSSAPQRNDRAIFFPKRRYDIKAFWKVPPSKQLVLGAGFTRFDYGGPGHGQIFNIGALYYYKKLVVEGNAFINRNQPGDFISGAGSFAAQYGTEGKYWVGATLGGGREQYRFRDVVPRDIRRSSISLNTFYRKWLSRHVGFVVSFDYQERLDAYRRFGAATGLFFEF